MLSSFGVQGFIADKFFKDRTIIVGDAAHLISPIGGQGMNLGWMDAWDLAFIFYRIFTVMENSVEGIDVLIRKEFTEFEKAHKNIAKAALNRAELFMFLGSKKRPKIIRLIAILLFKSVTLQWIVTNMFTMNWLGKIVIY